MFARTPLLVVLLGALLLGGCASETDQSAPAEPASERPKPTPDVGTELVEVPDVSGMDGQDAVDAIEAEGLTATYDDDDPAGCTVDVQDETGEVEPETEVILTLDCRQRDWENREGDDWDLFTANFARGAERGCGVLFSLSPTATLYANDREYISTDCTLATNEDPESADAAIPEEVPDDPEGLGFDLGGEHGCHALFDAELIDVLSYGTDSFTAEDCLTSWRVAPRPHRSARAARFPCFPPPGPGSRRVPWLSVIGSSRSGSPPTAASARWGRVAGCPR